MERLTIDEAIAKEKEEAKRLRKIIETGYDGEISIEAIFCDDTDAIKEAYERFENCAKEHEQLAEWLEELKAYKETKCNKSVYLANKSIDMIDAVNKGYAEGYNKASDDFAYKLNAKCDGMIKEKWNSNVSPISWAEAYADFKDDIDEIAEQLKAGEYNE